MKRTDNPDGGYVLTADAGRELAISGKDGSISARAKEVIIPAAGTLNTWIEVAEEIPKPADTAAQEDAAKSARIESLEAELAALRA
ncbi:MAG: hypothetical protein RR394_06900 [Oscillospiraceae bacterium]